VEYGDRMTPEQLDDIRELINGELETLLGDSKAEFVNAILSTTGAELIQRFTEWKDNTAHFNTYDFTANDLVSLVNALGIQIESINLTQPVEDASEPVTIQTGDFELFATTPGEFAAEVKCFDSQGILLGSATCRVDVIDTGDTSGMDATSASVLALIVEPKDLEGLKASEGLDAIMMFAFGVALPEEDPGDEGLYIYDEYRWVRVAKNSDGTLGAIKTYDWSETDQVTYANTIRFYSTGSLFIREIHQESITDQKKAAFVGGFSNDNIYEYGWHATYFEVEGNLESVLHYSKESKIDQIAISYFDSGEVRATREITYTDGLEGTSLVINYENDTYGYYKYLEEERTVVFGERGRYIGTYDVVEWIEIGGNRDGTFIQYHPDGSINTETSYVDGEYDGQYTTYLLDGGINASGMYVLGEMDGTWTKYDSNTHDYYTIEYNMGDKVD
jgi:antitoxin component YwqK of YwqJK toxin-antitoxin module